MGNSLTTTVFPLRHRLQGETNRPSTLYNWLQEDPLTEAGQI